MRLRQRERSDSEGTDKWRGRREDRANVKVDNELGKHRADLVGSRSDDRL